MKLPDQNFLLKRFLSLPVEESKIVKQQYNKWHSLYPSMLFFLDFLFQEQTIDYEEEMFRIYAVSILFKNNDYFDISLHKIEFDRIMKYNHSTKELYIIRTDNYPSEFYKSLPQLKYDIEFSKQCYYMLNHEIYEDTSFCFNQYSPWFDVHRSKMNSRAVDRWDQRHYWSKLFLDKNDAIRYAKNVRTYIKNEGLFKW